LNFEKFVAKRLFRSKNLEHSISKPIMRMAISAVSLSVVIMILAIASGKGLQEKISDKVTGFCADIQITHFDLNKSSELEPLEVDTQKIAFYKSLPFVNNVQFQITKNALIKSGNQFEGIIVKGVDQSYNWRFIESHLIDGKLPKYKHTEKSNAILISSKIAKKLNIEIGDVTLFYFQSKDKDKALVRQFNVSGIYKTGVDFFDDVFVIADLKHLQKINRWSANEVGCIEIQLSKNASINEAYEFISKNSSFDQKLKTAQQLYPQIFDWIKLFDLNIAVILLIMILVASINMISTLLILILERSRMIGLMKTLGAQNFVLKKIFLHYAYYLLQRALIIGNSVALVVIFIQQQFELIQLNPEHYYVKTLPLKMTGIDLIYINIGTIIICLTLLVLPAFIIQKIEPLKILRYE